jgi:hypothetical protein
MTIETRVVLPGPNENTVRTQDGKIIPIPPGWELLPPGDAGLTRRVKTAGPTWTIQEKKGRRTFSKGVLAPSETILSIRLDLVHERSTESYAKRKIADANRREKKQSEYVEDFGAAVVDFLNFASCYSDIAVKLSAAVTSHATPVGSGTVARTERIPIEQRAESAVIAWMRHQTTAYDDLKIARVKGKRREVRRELAEQSRLLLNDYRRGHSVDKTRCPLRKALEG